MAAAITNQTAPMTNALIAIQRPRSFAPVDTDDSEDSDHERGDERQCEQEECGLSVSRRSQEKRWDGSQSESE